MMRDEIFDMVSGRADHEMYWHGKNDKFSLFSAITMYSYKYCHNYEYFVRFCNWMNNQQSGYVEEDRKKLTAPTKLEFLEILEHEEYILQNLLNRKDHIKVFDGSSDFDKFYLWPKKWGEETWGGGGLLPGFEDCKNGENGYKIAERMLKNVQDAIATHKILMGHHSSIELSWLEQICISFLQNIFLTHKDFYCTIALPSIVVSYDNTIKSAYLVNEEKTYWDIDNILGICDYNKNEGEIRLYSRAISKCAKDLEISESYVRLITLIHELAHWFVYKVHDNNNYGNTGQRSDYAKWVNDYHESDKAFKEGWAQLLTYWTLQQIDSLKTFNTLNEHQSKEYQIYKEILNKCDDKNAIISSLIELRSHKQNISFDSWKKIL